MNGRRLIVVVEDDPMIARLVQRTLEKASGFTVWWTESPTEVLELAKQRECCLVIMDVSLSNSRYEGREMDGIAITQLLKSNPGTNHLPVLLLTAHAMRGDAERFLKDSGADAYLSKPIEGIGILVKTVDALLQRAGDRLNKQE